MTQTQTPHSTSPNRPAGRELPRVCVIGAGSSGIAAAKALHERGIPFDCFEKSDRVGGNWVFDNQNGMSAAYRYLHINTSREVMEYSDFPMPKEYPDFPHHSHIARYFDAYVDHFGFRERIVFETGVQSARRTEEGLWEITLDTGDTRLYDALMVANGHHWDPRWPEPAFPGSDTFGGVQIHAHSYIDNESLRDRDVVVLGMGNSAMDIAVESSYVARNTYLAARRGVWILPKYIAGRPVDQPVLKLLRDARVPLKIRHRVGELVLKQTVGKLSSYGLPEPDHRFGQAHPTVSGRILDRIGHGTIAPKPNIARLSEDSVEFADGSSVHADVVIYCTGYKITFPFFAEDFICAPDNHIDLFWRVFHPEIDNLFFVGLLQPWGAVMPLAELQGRWVGDLLRGEYALPAQGELRQHIQADHRAMQKRYVASKRHTIQVDADDYVHGVEKERLVGAARSRDRGGRLPIPARVAGRPGVSSA
jgi:dimethylaniline monooxygenase (N-oxide forming)